MQSYEQADIKGLAVGGLAADARGNKRAGFSPFAFKLPSLRCPFGASLWQDAEGDRKNICFSLDNQAVLEFFERLDQRILELAYEKSKEFFGAQHSMEVLQTLYTPLVRLSSKERYPPVARAKINLLGRKAVRCYDAAYKPIPIPEDLATDMIPAMLLTHLWFQSKSFGAILEVTHALIAEPQVACPFGTPEEQDVPM